MEQIDKLKEIANASLLSELSLFALVINLCLGFILSIMVMYHYRTFSSVLTNKSTISRVLPFIILTTVLVISIVKSSLALSLGLVGALSIVRFRTPIKEPEELVYLFLVISIGLANGANQFLLSIIATLIIVTFLLLRNYYQSKNKSNFQFNADANILNININDNKFSKYYGS